MKAVKRALTVLAIIATLAIVAVTIGAFYGHTHVRDIAPASLVLLIIVTARIVVTEITTPKEAETSL